MKRVGRKVVGALCGFALLSICLTSSAGAQNTTEKNTEAITQNPTEKKLSSIVIDKFEFQEVSIQMLVDYLGKKSIELDPEKKGVNIVLKLNDDMKKNPPKVTITLKGVSLGDAIKYVCTVSNLDYRIEPQVVLISSKDKDSKMVKGK